jgi:hypothetical protein
MTWYFLRIPRLLATLLLGPVFTSILIVILQLLVSAIFIQTQSTSTAEKLAQHLNPDNREANSPSGFRRILIGKDSLSEVQVCSWQLDKTAGLVKPATPGCDLERYDVVVTPSVVEEFGAQYYQELFKGLFRAIHICEGCKTDIVIWRRYDGIRTEFGSVLAFFLFQAVNQSNDFLEGFREPTPMTALQAKIIMVLNIGFLIVIALWLALKAHRRVLDYLSHSGVLLPMVAAVGTTNFYTSIWLMTLIRVFAFIAAAFPLGILVLIETLRDPFASPFYGRPWALLGWSLSLSLSFGLAALIASVSELKHNHDIVNIHYKLAPLLASSMGGLVWLLTFFIEHPFSDSIRGFIGAIPVVGIAPILLAPVFEPYWHILAINSLGTVVILYFVARYNSRWFAAHIDSL